MSRIGYAALHAAKQNDYAIPIAGIIQPANSIPREALNLLDQLIRHRSVGVPEEPMHILLPGKWKDGPSLPVKEVKQQQVTPKRRVAV